MGICCDGIEKHCVIAVGTHGNIKLVKEREIFLKGLDAIVKKIEPIVIVVYGSAPDKYFKKYMDAGIKVVQFDSDYAVSHKEAV